MVDETRETGATVSLVARRRCVLSNQLFTLATPGRARSFGGDRAEEEVVPVFAFRAQQEQLRELQRRASLPSSCGVPARAAYDGVPYGPGLPPAKTKEDAAESLPPTSIPSASDAPSTRLRA
jgi:hypothetical protein